MTNPQIDFKREIIFAGKPDHISPSYCVMIVTASLPFFTSLQLNATFYITCIHSLSDRLGERPTIPSRNGRPQSHGFQKQALLAHQNINQPPTPAPLSLSLQSSCLWFGDCAMVCRDCARLPPDPAKPMRASSITAVCGRVAE